MCQNGNQVEQPGEHASITYLNYLIAILTQVAAALLQTRLQTRLVACEAARSLQVLDSNPLF